MVPPGQGALGVVELQLPEPPVVIVAAEILLTCNKRSERNKKDWAIARLDLVSGIKPGLYLDWIKEAIPILGKLKVPNIKSLIEQKFFISIEFW